MTAPAVRPARDTIAGILAARNPHLPPSQCRLPVTVILRQLVVAAGRACALAAVWPQPAAPCTSASSSSRPGHSRRLAVPFPAASAALIPQEEKPAMTSDQPPPGTSGQPSPALDGLLPSGSVVTVAGPWTVRSCVTAACTRCGAVPLDEDTSMTPHFADTSQAAQELAQNWGWHHERGTWPKNDVLLCPRCAALPGGARPARKGNGLKAAGCQVPGWEREPDPDARREVERIIRRQREAEQEAARTAGPQVGREAEAGQ